MIAVYVAPSACPNSRRFCDKLRRDCTLPNVVEVDVTKCAPPEGLTAVPTVVLEDGQTFVGQAAFEWLRTVAPSTLSPGARHLDSDRVRF